MTERLYYTDPYLREFDADRRRADDARGTDRASSSIGRRSIRRPAASRSTSGRCRARRSSTSSTTEDGRILHVVDRAPDGGACHRRRSTGRAASITCSSTPGSTCCRPRSIGCSNARTESFHLGADYSTIDLARELSAGRDRARGRRGQPRRLGRPAGRDPLRRRRRRSRRCRSARNPSARGRCA